jgi:hypothetical protein
MVVNGQRVYLNQVVHRTCWECLGHPGIPPVNPSSCGRQRHQQRPPPSTTCTTAPRPREPAMQHPLPPAARGQPVQHRNLVVHRNPFPAFSPLTRVPAPDSATSNAHRRPPAPPRPTSPAPSPDARACKHAWRPHSVPRCGPACAPTTGVRCACAARACAMQWTRGRTAWRARTSRRCCHQAPAHASSASASSICARWRACSACCCSQAALSLACRRCAFTW